MPEHGFAGVTSPQMTTIDWILQYTSGKVVTVGDGAEASNVSVAAQPARYGFKLHGRHSSTSSDLDQPLDQWLDQNQ
jgi:hypothetical protein